MTEANFNGLPNEILRIIFTNLSIKDRYYNRQVCKRWNLILQSLSDNVWTIVHHTVNLSGFASTYKLALLDDTLNLSSLKKTASKIVGLKIFCLIDWSDLCEFLPLCTQLQELYLYKCYGDSFPNLYVENTTTTNNNNNNNNHNATIRRLYFGSCCKFDISRGLKKIKNLNHLTFQPFHLNYDLERYILHSESLKSLHIDRFFSGVDNQFEICQLLCGLVNKKRQQQQLTAYKQDGINIFVPPPPPTETNENLKSIDVCGLELSHKYPITDLLKSASGLQFLRFLVPTAKLNWDVLSNNRKLRYLYVANDCGCMDTVLPKLTNLLALDVASFSTISDDTLKALGNNCRNLGHLNIGGCKRIYNKDVASLLKNIIKLETFFIDNCFHLTYACLADIDLYGGRQLKAISLQNLTEDKTYLSDLKKLKYIQYLNVAFCPLDDDWFMGTDFQVLTVCKLSHTLLGDKGVGHLVKVSCRIRELNLTATNISYDGLTTLKNVDSLRVLDVSCCAGIDDGKLKEFYSENLLHYFYSLPCPSNEDCPCIILHRKNDYVFHNFFSI